jgi:hypothetical protein
MTISPRFLALNFTPVAAIVVYAAFGLIVCLGYCVLLFGTFAIAERRWAILAQPAVRWA